MNFLNIMYVCVKYKSNEMQFNFNYKKYDPDYIEKLFSIYELQSIPKANRLTKKEKTFYCNLVYLFNQGHDVNTPEITKQLSNIKGLSMENRGVYIYKSKLKKKKWLVVDAQGRLDIPPFLKISKDVINFSISLSYDQTA